MLVTIYGLKIETGIPLPLSQLVKAEGEADVRIGWLQDDRQLRALPRVDWNELEDKPPVLQVNTLCDGEWLQLQYEDGTGFLVNRAATEVWVKHPPQATIEDTTTYIVGPVLGFLLRLRGVTAIHASAVAVDGHCFLLVGRAGAGKSTTAAAFAARGSPVLTEDVAALDRTGDGFRVQPGYPRVNLWPPAVELLFGSADALPRICPLHPTWNKRYLDLSARPDGFWPHPLPLGAIYVLDDRLGSSTAPRAAAMNPSDALVLLIANTYANYIRDTQMQAVEFDDLSRLVDHVPVRRVVPHADPHRIWDLCQLILDDFSELQKQRMSRSASAPEADG